MNRRKHVRNIDLNKEYRHKVNSYLGYGMQWRCLDHRCAICKTNTITFIVLRTYLKFEHFSYLVVRPIFIVNTRNEKQNKNLKMKFNEIFKISCFLVSLACLVNGELNWIEKYIFIIYWHKFHFQFRLQLNVINAIVSTIHDVVIHSIHFHWEK